MVTIRTIAEHCGVSIAAVSRALNHQPGISEKKAEQIRQAAKALGYYPNAAARALKMNRTNTIGIIYRNRLAHEFFSVVLEGVHDEAARCGYELTFLNSTPHAQVFDHAIQRQCAGVLLVQGEHGVNNDTILRHKTLPTVTLEHRFSDCTTVMTNNITAMEEIVRYLHQKGHRRIAFVHGESDGEVTRDRLAGFYRGCRDCGITVPDDYVYEGCYRVPDLSAEATRKLLSLPEPPTCIIYPDDMSYLGGQAEIERQGLRIPEDISCFGFDGTLLSRMLRPRLTTYYQDAEAIGRLAMKELVSAIEDPHCFVAQTLFVPGHIQEGQTVMDLNR